MTTTQAPPDPKTASLTAAVRLPRPRTSRTATPRALIVPLIVFQTVMCFAPQLYFYSIAFATSTGPGAFDASQWTLENFGQLFTSPIYRNAIGDTLVFAVSVVFAVLLLGFPLAYVISRSRTWGVPLLAIVIVTSFTSVIVRVLGWKILLGDAGPINTALQHLGLIAEPLRLVNSLPGAVIGTVNAVLPLVVLLLIPVMDQIPRSVEDASAGLGAGRARTLWRVVLPLSRAGLLGSAFVTFAYAMGSFTTPALLGGNSMILSVLISQQVRTSVNYPMAATLALTLMALVVVVLLVATRFDRKKVSG